MNTALGEEATGGAGSGSETLAFLQGGDFSSVFWATDVFPTPMEVAHIPTVQAHKTHKSSGLSHTHICTHSATEIQQLGHILGTQIHTLM